MTERDRAAIAGEVSAPAEMLRVLDGEPQSVWRIERRGIALQRWSHGPLHQATRAMSDHVFMTYWDTPHRIERRGDGGTERAVTRNGTVTLIPSGSSSRWDIDGPLRVTHLYLDPKRLSAVSEALELSNQPELASRTAVADPLGSQLLLSMEQALRQPDRLSTLQAEVNAEALCLHLLRQHATSTRLPRKAARGPSGLAPWQIKRLTDYIRAHLCDDVGLSELAALVSLSPSHLCRAFKISTGSPPHRWRQGLRIERARDLLDRSELSIADVAASVGYDDPSLFARVFGRAVGVTPSEYRRQRH